MFFNRRKKRYDPIVPEAFEGTGISGEVAFVNSQKSWEESFDLLDILEDVLQQFDIAVKRQNSWLIINDDLYLHPGLVSFQPLETGGASTVTSIAISHEKYATAGLFEYQHASGDDMCASLAAGFDNWVQLDLGPLLDAVRNEEKMSAVMNYPTPGFPNRRALLGPIYHVASRDIDIEEEHPFCPCCLLTNSHTSLDQFFESEQLYGVRLFAIRDANGEISADCRVNGTDWEPGKEQLIAYAQTWPDRGFEARKQYVVIHSKDSD